MATSSLNLVVIRSADLDRAAEFYGMLGLRFTKHSHGGGPEHLSCELGPLVFEIYPRMNETDSTAIIRLGFVVPSLKDAVSRLEEAGAKVRSRPKPSPWGWRAVVEDCDGHKIELTEKKAIKLK